MNWNPLLGLLALAYAGVAFWMVIKKPETLWGIGKVQGLIKVLGEKGTDILFYAVSGAALGLGIWLFTL